MRILHTSDWHLGRSFYGSRRMDAFAAFLDWLADLVEKQQIDALLIAGDIFDTVTPGNRSQALYYQFLSRITRSCCRQVVVTAGNHDSPSFLEAPKALLSTLHVQVVATPGEQPDDEVIVLCDVYGQAEAIVCAVPYLRDRDIRTVAADESVDDKQARLLAGIHDHYAAVCARAEQLRSQLGQLPLIVMGHLFTAGGRTIAEDGVRELYVGSLAHVPTSLFPDTIDYLALGHLHIAQTVGQNPAWRYCGSPLPMGFGETGQVKQVLQVDFAGRRPNVTVLPVPCFQPLARVSGTAEEILAQITELKDQQPTAWIEVDYTGPAHQSNLRDLLADSVAGTDLEIRRIKNRQAMDRVLAAMQSEEQLDELDIYDVFQRCLDQAEIPEADQLDLMLAYREIAADLTGADRRAED